MSSHAPRPVGVIAARRRAMMEAKADLERARASGSDATHVRACRAFLQALQDYEAALAAAGAPLPHRLRLELQLYRTLAASR